MRGRIRLCNTGRAVAGQETRRWPECDGGGYFSFSSAQADLNSAVQMSDTS